LPKARLAGIYAVKRFVTVLTPSILISQDRSQPPHDNLMDYALLSWFSS